MRYYRPRWHGIGPILLLFLVTVVLSVLINQALRNDFKDVLEVQRVEIQRLEDEVENLRHQKESLEEALQRRVQQVHDLLNRLDAVESFPGALDEISLLERLVTAEALGEGHEGMVAVANVVLNRVSSEDFPGTITDVILQPGQFCPVRTGVIHQVTLQDEARAAVADAMAGHQVVPGEALFFYNPALVSRGHWIRSRTTVADIGNHRFAE